MSERATTTEIDALVEEMKNRTEEWVVESMDYQTRLEEDEAYARLLTAQDRASRAEERAELVRVLGPFVEMAIASIEHPRGAELTFQKIRAGEDTWDDSVAKDVAEARALLLSSPATREEKV